MLNLISLISPCLQLVHTIKSSRILPLSSAASHLEELWYLQGGTEAVDRGRWEKVYSRKGYSDELEVLQEFLLELRSFLRAAWSVLENEQRVLS